MKINMPELALMLCNVMPDQTCVDIACIMKLEDRTVTPSFLHIHQQCWTTHVTTLTPYPLDIKLYFINRIR